MTEDVKQFVSMQLFITTLLSLSVLGGTILGGAFIYLSDRIDGERQFVHEEIEMVGNDIAALGDELRIAIAQSQEFSAQHRVRLWDRAKATDDKLAQMAATLSKVEGGQEYLLRGMERLIQLADRKDKE